MGEEDCLRGWRGSGTIFFSMCNLRCVFCQNFDISHEGYGRITTPEYLSAMMLKLQAAGCHNINFVTPEHNVPQVLEALVPAIEGGLRIPLVYNTSAYDSLESLRLLDGIVDIYMPDFKIWDPEHALRYLKAKDYPQVARAAITEMHRQVGALTFDQNGLALRGVLIRHLVMPEDIAGTSAIMHFLAQEISTDTYVNIMRQYRPSGKVNAEDYSEINRRISHQEYQQAFIDARQAGLWRFDQRL
jgi:putative pyruvate formate lyase activating enzyme